MILIIGGAYQGKREFAKEKFGLLEEEMMDGRICAFEEAFQKNALFNLHFLVERLLREKINPIDFFSPHLSENSEQVFICDEVGLGVVPICKEERLLREEVGRLLCQIARASEKVYRIYCGLPALIKGEEA